jgi:tRNA pseudouridine38-40 synthase
MVLNPAKRTGTVNIKLTIEYDGKKYFGWQRQKNLPAQAGKPTIQQTIEESLQVLFPTQNIKLTGAGRTDAGVHALGQVSNFRIDKDLNQKLDLHKLAYQLNSILPRDITVKKAEKVSDDFHARYSAKKRVYRYQLSGVKRSFNGDKYLNIGRSIDIKAAGEFCKTIEGAHSFKSMCKNKSDEHDFMSIVYYAKLKKKKDNILEFEICANRFLHSMVRAIVGMLIRVGSGKTSLREFKEKFKKGETIKIQYVPANALILAKIIY